MVNCENVLEDLVSVIMPVYNVDKYIDEAISSLVRQDYGKIEIIIVDDCSTDDTYSKIKKWTEIDDRIKVFRNDENKKICKTLNLALTKAKGQYVIRADGDDISEPNRISVLKKILDENPDIDIVGSQLISIDEEGKVLSYKKYPINPGSIKYSNKYISSVPHFWMTRRSVYEKLNGYRDIPFAEDYDLLLRGELLGMKYLNSSDYLYRCRIRRGNTTSSNGLIQRKTVHFVRHLHKVDMQNNFKVDDKAYKTSLLSSDKERESYIKAFNQLKASIFSKSKFDKLRYGFNAFVGDKYIREYMVEAIIFRMIILIDRRL